MSTFMLVVVALGATLMVCATTVRFVPQTAGGYYSHVKQNWIWLDRLAWALGIGCVIALFICGIIAVIIYPSRAVGRTTCRNFAAQSGYQTKFVILNWADTGTCLAKAPNGRWVKNTSIIVNVPAK